MVHEYLRVRPGDMVSVDFAADPPRVVYMWWRATVAEIDSGRITIATASGKPQQAAVLDGLSLSPRAGDTVFLHRPGVGRGPLIVDLAVSGEPAHPDRFTDAYAPIRARIDDERAARTKVDVPSELTFDGPPAPVLRLADLMSTYSAPWALCGGWAVDAWRGRQTRTHGDADLAVFQDDNRALLDHLVGWQLIAHDPNVSGDTTDAWNGRRLDLPGHIHGRLGERETGDRLTDAAGQGFDLDVQVSANEDGNWMFSATPRVGLSLDRCIRPTFGDVPTLVPEGLLFYKATGLGKDTIDFETLLPTLDAAQRLWLRDAISAVHPDHHPWLRRLGT